MNGVSTIEPEIVIVVNRNFFETNSNFPIPKFVQQDGVHFWYFKLKLFDLTEFIVRNVKGLQHLVAKSWYVPITEIFLLYYTLKL